MEAKVKAKIEAKVVEKMKTIKLGILGMGTVASGLANILKFNNSKIIRELNIELIIDKVLVNSLDKKRNVNLPQEIYTTNVYDVLDNKDTEIVVELIGGINPAYEYIKKALNNKKHVVTANKALIATHGEELEFLAVENGVMLLYEASVGGGIPILNTIRDNLSGNEFESVFGIINGTTNYILTQMTENNLEYELAVKEAQRLGFAEADPSSDVDGDDAVYKLSILSTLAFGQKVYIENIFKKGITNISKDDINYGKELGYNVKLLASGIKANNELELCVHPAFIPKDHPLSGVKNEFNAVFLKGNAVGELMLYGRGAGSLPTGSAILSDIMNIVRNKDKVKGEIRVEAEVEVEGLRLSGDDSDKKYSIANRGFKQYYIRLKAADEPEVLGSIVSMFGKNEVRIVSAIQKQDNGDRATFIIVTDKTERENIDSSLNEIKKSANADLKSIIIVEDFK